MPLPKQSRQDSFFYEPRDEPALKRMRFLNGRWDQLNWYVELIAKDLSRLSKGEWSILQEEVVAIHRTLSNYPNAKTPERQALVYFQDISKLFQGIR